VRRAPDGAKEYAALARAMENTRPPCSDDARFIADQHELDEDTLIEMRRTCLTCPMRTLCRAYATKTKPTAGMWAGSYYTKEKP
jgi:hypothetical protein